MNLSLFDRYTLAEQHCAPLRPPFNQPAFNPKVRVTFYRDGKVHKTIKALPERARAAVARYRQAEQARRNRQGHAST